MTTKVDVIKHKKDLGQYFTIADDLPNFIKIDSPDLTISLNFVKRFKDFVRIQYKTKW